MGRTGPANGEVRAPPGSARRGALAFARKRACRLMGAVPAGIHEAASRRWSREPMISVRERRSTKGDGSMAGRVNPHPGILLYTRIKKSPYYYAARRHGV